MDTSRYWGSWSNCQTHFLLCLNPEVGVVVAVSVDPEVVATVYPEPAGVLRLPVAAVPGLAGVREEEVVVVAVTAPVERGEAGGRGGEGRREGHEQEGQTHPVEERIGVKRNALRFTHLTVTKNVAVPT